MSEGSVSSENDLRPRFELNVSLPSDVRFAETARELAVHAAKHAGYSDARARAIGERVEQIIHACLKEGTGTTLPLVVRRTTGPVEILVDGRTLSLDP
jgi:hypothetical protein